MDDIIKKPWGQEEILETNEFYTVKRLTMFDKCQCSKQYHNNKKETIYVVYGMLTLYLENSDSVFLLDPGNSWTIEPKQIHRMAAKNEVLQKVKNNWYLPISKSESASTDRGIATIFDKYNIEIIGLDTYSPERFDDPNTYYYFSKTYANRK